MNSEEEIVFRDYPLWLLLPGLATLVFAVWLPSLGTAAWERFFLALIGVALIGFDSVLTVSVDRARGVLKLRYQSLFHASASAYPLIEICSVNVAEDWEGERMYRLEIILRSGQVVPLRRAYSVGKAIKERKAQRLRSVLGGGGR